MIYTLKYEAVLMPTLSHANTPSNCTLRKYMDAWNPLDALAGRVPFQSGGRVGRVVTRSCWAGAPALWKQYENRA